MQHVSAALQYEELSSYSILIKCNFSHFTLWMVPSLCTTLPDSPKESRGRYVCYILFCGLLVH